MDFPHVKSYLGPFEGQMNQNFYIFLSVHNWCDVLNEDQKKHILKFESNWTWHRRDRKFKNATVNRRAIGKIVRKLSETNSDVTIDHLKNRQGLKLEVSDFERKTMVFSSASYFFGNPVKTPKKETR